MVIRVHATYVHIHTFTVHIIVTGIMHTTHTYTLTNTSNYTYILHLTHITNIHTKYVTHSTYQSHASQIHLCCTHNPMAPSLITFPLSNVRPQPRAEKGRVAVNTGHASRAGGLGPGCEPQGTRWEQEAALGERTCVLCARVHAARGQCAPTLSGCVCVCVNEGKGGRAWGKAVRVWKPRSHQRRV